MLRAGETIKHSLPVAPVNAGGTAWFEFHTGAADSGVGQKQGVHTDGYASNALELRLTGANGTTVLGTDTEAEPDPAHPGKWRLSSSLNETGPAQL